MKEFELLIKTAKAETGYHEVGTNGNKFAEYIDKNFPDFYNGKKAWDYVNGTAHGGAEWCDIFVDANFLKCFGEEKTLYMLCQPRKSCGAGCKYSAGYYRSHNRWGHEPKIGAQIFFGRQGNESHTGIVIDVNNGFVLTVEGNSNNAVVQRAYAITNSNIAGYGYPRYSDEEVINTGEKYPGVFPTLPARGYFQRGDKGVNVTRLMQFLKWYNPTYFPKYGIDGKFGNEVLTAVLDFEGREGIKQDGLCGPVCLKRAKEIRK